VRRLFRNLALYAFHIGFVRPVLRWVVGLRFRRRSLLPRGPCIVVSNHNSHLDAAILATIFPLRRLPSVHPVAAADYFGTNWFMRMLALLFMNGIPIRRRPERGKDPLAPVIEALAAGESLIFFPEGSRGEAGVVAPFRAGIGRLVRQLPGLLVVPVFLSGPERIWARGQVVPVPSNIDAIIGKPRTYSPDEEARVIAERIRNDVLALAPPPPPMPVPHPDPPVRVAICGLDDELRRKVYRRVVERLAVEAKTIGVSDPIIEADSDGVREVTGPIPLAPRSTWVSLLSRVFRTGGLFKGEKFVSMVQRAQIDEALGQGTARFVVTDGSALVDLMAWADADFYRGRFDDSKMNHVMQYLAGRKQIPARLWLRYIRFAPEVWLINIFSLARPPLPDVLVLPCVATERLMSSIRSRGEAIESFENETFLTDLRAAYQRVAGLLEKRRRVDVISTELESGDIEPLVERIVAECLRRGEQSASA